MGQKPAPSDFGGPDRRWRIPPVPAHVSHSFTGAPLLEELSGPLGFALWQTFRDVQLWTLSPPRERERLFAPGSARTRAVPAEVAGAEAELRAPLATLRAMVDDAGAATEEEVGKACAAVSRWAEARGSLASALAFAEAAASAAPADAALAYEAGRLARRLAEYARAETWLLRAAGLGRRSGDWEAYALAFLGMGRLHQQRGSVPRARKHFLRAMRASHRHGLRDFEGEAMHNLLMLYTESGDLVAAEAWGREAYRVYGPDHPELPRMAHDLAHVWSLRGFFGRAEAVFRALLPHFDQPADRLFVLSNLVRATGGAGSRDGYEEAWSAAWDLAGDPGALDSAARSLLDMARGAATMGDGRRAAEAAVRCVEVATRRGEAKAQAEAQALLAALGSGLAGVADPGADAPADTLGDALAAEIVECLNASPRT
ncbi:MAG TPA: hypothetical protein VHG51_20190 [Longimicrobiaceae bacterium]|nr:hypothetical protein [Longimicrobiaceae bacterium]